MLRRSSNRGGVPTHCESIVTIGMPGWKCVTRCRYVGRTASRYTHHVCTGSSSATSRTGVAGQMMETLKGGTRRNPRSIPQRSIPRRPRVLSAPCERMG